MIPSISRILFTTDLSKNSAHAFKTVVGLAKATGAEIRILHVCERLSDDAQVTLEIFIQDAAARKDALSKRVGVYKDTLAERQEVFWSNLPPDDQAVRSQVVSTKVAEGFPAEVILKEAAANDCDLIVLGAHEHGLSHTFLGNTAKRVLRRATIPTLVVPLNQEA